LNISQIFDIQRRFLRSAHLERDPSTPDGRPTMVLNAALDSTERRQFARRVTTGLPAEDARRECAG
jgi:hypothetical protein